MHSVKYNKIKFMTTMKTLHDSALGAILRKSFGAKEYTPNKLI
jgi:hypothetical protein